MATVRKCIGKLPSMLLAVVDFGFFTLALQSAWASSTGATPFELAAEHAGLAAEASTVTVIHGHLQRTLDCLEGNNGQDFKPMPGQPLHRACRHPKDSCAGTRA
jgi:hypothetical protein